ncbi:hypothetical protein J2S74_000194 [Evansella vedderi]|uniref:NADH dehydrogenase subunit 4L n=1 Tax=Evansella vedderi TaxID=38282 RepID=A0ABT9ZQ27_9BACI|nr:hypothetical protein [Evansella vedderi]MDQ0252822.1 hypothetical protein [Evansella vedderi]
MTDWIIDYKWHLLILSEILGWGFTFVMIYARYFLESKILFWLSLVITLFLCYVLDIYLFFLSYTSGERFLGWYEWTIILLFVYLFTVGKKHLKKLDAKGFEYAQKLNGGSKNDKEG